MNLKNSGFYNINLNLFRTPSLPDNLKHEFQRNLAVLNFHRARTLAILLFITNLPLLYGDYMNYRKGIWDSNPGYRLLFDAHVILGVGMALLILGERFIFPFLKKRQKDQGNLTCWQVGFAMATALMLLCIAGYISGGVDQLLHQQITVYILAALTVSAIIYFRPTVSFLIYMVSYLVFYFYLQSFQLDRDLLRGHIINGALLAVIAWFFSVALYQLRLRDFQTQMTLEEIVEQRTAELEEVNCQLEEEIIERQRLDDEITQFFKVVPDLLCFLNFDFILTRVNSSFFDLMGYGEEDIRFISIFELAHPEDILKMRDAFEECKQKHSSLTKLETRLRCFNGEYISVEWNAVPDFERQLIFAVARDVTERNLNQRKIYRLASIVESTDDGIIGMTSEGMIQYWNQGAENIYGYSANEMVGKSIYSIIPDERYNEVVDILKKAAEGNKISHFETERRHQDGRILEVSLTVSPIKDNEGNVIGISTILRDISSNKRMERELTRLDRLNLIGEMAASISHEVRNPMTTVRGFLQLLYDKDDCVKYQSYFNLMIDELDRANSILTEFLSISRTKMTAKKRQSLNSIVYSILPLIEASAVSSDMLIHTELKELPELPLDDKEMRQIILNLARNGVEAMKAGQTLTIRTYALEEEVVLEVSDEGHGISPDLIDRLGTPFLTTKNEGTGLGLAICHGIAARHDARIEVKSSGSGSTFSVRFKRQ